MVFRVVTQTTLNKEVMVMMMMMGRTLKAAANLEQVDCRAELLAASGSSSQGCRSDLSSGVILVSGVTQRCKLSELLQG